MVGLGDVRGVLRWVEERAPLVLPSAIRFAQRLGRILGPELGPCELQAHVCPLGTDAFRKARVRALWRFVGLKKEELL